MTASVSYTTLFDPLTGGYPILRRVVKEDDEGWTVERIDIDFATTPPKPERLLKTDWRRYP